MKQPVRKQFFFHLILCSIFLLMPFFLSFRPPGEPFLTITRPFLRDVIADFLLLAFFYINYYLFIPLFYFKQRYILFVICISGCLLFICVVPSLITRGLSTEIAPPPSVHINHQADKFSAKTDQPLFNSFYDGVKQHLYLFMVALFFSVLLQERSRMNEIREEKLRAELSSLKAQISPHFLFNTLNSIYALTVKKDEKASDAVINLAGLMRYIITDAKNNKILLEKELDYIESYIDLQQSRLRDTVKVAFLQEGEPGTNEIAPLLLITFIENAFKYGVNPDDEHSLIKIDIHVVADVLVLDVANSISNLSHKELSTGIGLKNAKERLELLYPGKYSLNIKNTEKDYLVNLSIKLT